MQALLVVDFLQELPDQSLGFIEVAVLGAVDFLVFESLNDAHRGRNGVPTQAVDAVASVTCARLQGPVLLPNCAAVPSRCSVAKRHPAESPNTRTPLASGCR